MNDLQPIDIAALGIVGIAALRGLFLGLIREAFSIGALAAAVIAVRIWNEPLADWIVNASDGHLGRRLAPWVTGALLGVIVIAAVGTFGRVMRQGARAVGLGWFDRLGGAALGFAEGALATGVLLLVISGALGRHHTVVANSRSIALLEQFERFASSPAPSAPDVAAPPRKR
jgi:membrane protein required for colicin V production